MALLVNLLIETPEIKRRTNRFLALIKKEQVTIGKLQNIVADIGDELIAIKAALDLTGEKTAWIRWLQSVDCPRRTASRYMSMGRLRKKMGQRWPIFLSLETACLYLLTMLTDEQLENLEPDTMLYDPETKERKPMKEMQQRELERSLRAFRKKKLVRTLATMAKRLKAMSKEIKEIARRKDEIPDAWETFQINTQRHFKMDGAQSTDDMTKEQFAKVSIAHAKQDAQKWAQIQRQSGKLKGTSKQAMVGAIESQRLAVLKTWPAWAKPVKGKT